MKGVSRLAGLVGCGLLLAYAAPLLAPPLTVAAEPDAGLLGRIFPGLPVWWVTARLACLAAGAILVAFSVARLPLRSAGEAGTTGAVPAVANAVIDALRPLGVLHVELPCTAHRVWQAIQAVRSKTP